MDKAKKKTIKRAVTWIALAALVAVLTAMPLLARQEQEADGPVASILEATAHVSSVSNVLKGGGILEAGTAMKVNLPSGVKIKEFLVKNGDTVTEGTPVAVVDRVSVMNAILSVEDTMEYLQKQIASADDDTISGTIKATAGGRVKQVYAQKGDSVQDVMLTYGCLAVLSLDGRMAVALEEKTALAAGDTVTVTISGKELDGRVESNLNGKLIITVEDDKYGIGESVTVTTREGNPIGTGELYVHNAWHATAFSGTVKNIHAREETEVNSGTTLLTLEDTDFEGTLQSLANLHREYEELLQRLFVMYESEILTAPCDGMVSGIDKDSPHLLAAVEGEDGWFVDLLDNKTNGAEKGWTVVKLTNNPGNGTIECDGTADEPDECKALTNHQAGCYYFCTGKENCTAKPGQHNNCLSQCTSASVIGTCPNSKITGGVHKKDCIDGCTSSDGSLEKPCNSDVHKPDCIKTCITSGGDKDCPATKHHNTNCIERCDKKETCPAVVHYSNCLTRCTETENCQAECHKANCYYAKLTYKGKAFWIWQVGIDGLIGRWDSGTTYEFTMGASGIQLTNPSKLSTTTLNEDGKIQGRFSQYKSGDVLLVWEAYNAENKPVKTGTSVYANIPVQGAGMDMSGMLEEMMKEMMGGLMGGFSFGNFGAYGAFGGAAAQQMQLHDLDGSDLMTVTDRETMTLTIAIDEHDIAKVTPGQIAQVEVTAIRGQTFEAEVTEVSNFGTNNGGSSKFTVELTMDQDPQMLSGMNATAQISLFTKMDVLTLPVAALSDTVKGTCVYTALDKKTGEPAMPVIVETGVSDGEIVEILSGLNAGDKVYYSYYDVLELDHTAKNEFAW